VPFIERCRTLLDAYILPMTLLLVSVCSAGEAKTALRGGADLIDIKDPARGSLGRAGDSVLTDVVAAVAGRRPISAALGELADNEPLPPDDFLTFAQFVKVGLAGLEERDWRGNLDRLHSQLSSMAPTCQLAVAAYADWKRAGAPAAEDVCDFVIREGLGGMLIDTWQKDGTTLPDWLTPAELTAMCRRCRQAGVAVALAGSLSGSAITRLRDARPDWFAVRGAACRSGNRRESIDELRVRELVTLLRTEVDEPHLDRCRQHS
jgi:(5-formylfuran-3-yl)methyl phosphate synthase